MLNSAALTRPTLADCLWPRSKQNSALARDILLILGGSMLVALSARVQVPGIPVPNTFQPFAVLLVGVTLGRTRGLLAMLAYLGEGAAGLPVFAGGGGYLYFAGPTTGYLLAFPLAAYVTGYFAEAGWDRRFVTTLFAMYIGQAIILLVGFAWLSFYIGPRAAFIEGLVKFLPGDVLKILLATFALPAAWRLVGQK